MAWHAATREAPALDACVELPAGRYVVGERGEERSVALATVQIGRWPVVNAQLLAFAEATGHRLPAAKLRDPQLADHPATDLARADAEAFCAWAAELLGRPVRLPSGDEWEALARGGDARPWPWGDVFDEHRCACVEAAAGWTVPVSAHPGGSSPLGAEQLAGNVWEWVADRTARIAASASSTWASSRTSAWTAPTWTSTWC